MLDSDLYSDVMERLQEVKDPEISTVSVLELGMIESVSMQDGELMVAVLPTFLGCPALELIKRNIEVALSGMEGVRKTNVQFIKDPPWTSDRVTENGRRKLREFGIAPPPVFRSADQSWEIACPYCGSSFTTMENLFGPTACRSILYCKSCRNPFEAMKPMAAIK